MHHVSRGCVHGCQARVGNKQKRKDGETVEKKAEQLAISDMPSHRTGRLRRAGGAAR